MSGLFDYPAPLFNALDAGLATFLPAWLRLVLFGILSGVLTMLVYRLASNQAGIKAQKARLKEIQAKLRTAQDDLAETMRLTRQNLATAFGLLGRVLGPALLSSLPVLFILAWLATHWGYVEPPAGTPVPVGFAPGSAGIALEPAGTLGGTAAAPQLVWPESGTELRLLEAGRPVWQGTPAMLATTAEVSQPRWWSWFIGNPAGFLAEEARLDRMSLELPQREILSFGPGWIRSWEFLYFVTVIIVSLGIKLVFKIA